MTKPCYKILVVDDSALIRQAIIAIINASEQLQVVGEAASGEEALVLIPRLKPDLVTLDVVMPGMNGLTALKYIMIFHPVPVVMLSSLTQDGSRITFDALRYGAIDFIAKPSKLEVSSSPTDFSDIVPRILTAVKIKARTIQYIRVKPKTVATSAPKAVCKNVVVFGVAEGGYGSLLKIIPRLRLYSTTSYMVLFYEASTHIDSFIEYLNLYSEVSVVRSQNHASLEAGVCYVSSGEEYVTVHGERGNYRVHVSAAPFSSRRGSIDMLMFSVAETYGRRALGVILTGAGTDGAEGLEEIIRVGGGAVIQAPVSCLYRSMALSALNACEAEVVVSDSEIAAEINHFLINLQ